MSISHLIDSKNADKQSIYVKDANIAGVATIIDLSTPNIEADTIEVSGAITTDSLEVKTSMSADDITTSTLEVEGTTTAADINAEDISATRLLVSNGIGFGPFSNNATSTTTLNIDTKNLVYCTFNTLASVAAGAEVKLTIRNTAQANGDVPFVWIYNQNTASNSCLVIKSMTALGSEVGVFLFNAGTAATGANKTIVFGYMLVNTNT